ncbi:MAG TPA: hypothetical protein ENK66_01785, partial [Arcobacter sp.]|nr:hypothetical protein [Arcobacter sp.]
MVQLNKSILFLLFFLSEVIAIDYDGLSINGYTTLGFTYSDNKNTYYKVDNTSYKTNGSSSHKLLTDAGLQLNYNYENFDFTYQASWRENNNDNFNTDYLNLKYSRENDFIRVGRMRLPVYAYNDLLHIKSAYTWTHVPSDLYSLTTSNVDGIEYYRNFLFKGYLIDLSLVHGDSPRHKDQNLGETFVDARVTSINSLRLGFDKDNYHVSSSYVSGKYNFEASIINDFNNLLDQLVAPINSDASNFVNELKNKYTLDQKNITSYSLSFNYDYDYLINSEYININIDDNVLMSEINAFYVNVGYRFDNFTPYIMYAKRNQKKYNTTDDENKLKQYADVIS